MTDKKKFTKVVKYYNGNGLEFKYPCRILEVWNTYNNRNINQGFVKFTDKDVWYNAVFHYHNNVDNLEKNLFQKEWNFSVLNETIGGDHMALIEYYKE